MATRPSSLTLYDRATPQERDEMRARSVKVPCRSCGAAIGQKCYTMSGKPSKPHEIRIRQAKRLAEPTEPTTEQRFAALEEQVAMLRGFLNI